MMAVFELKFSTSSKLGIIPALYASFFYGGYHRASIYRSGNTLFRLLENRAADNKLKSTKPALSAARCQNQLTAVKGRKPLGFHYRQFAFHYR
jgi:hypothetical protein